MNIVPLALALSAAVFLVASPAGAHGGHGGGGRWAGGPHRGLVGVPHGGVPVHVPRYSPPLTVYPPVRHHPPHVHRPPVYVAPAVVYRPVVRYVPPPVVYVPPPVTVYAPPVQQYWYYCTDYQAYYPYVEQCPSDWLRVLPN